MAYGPNNWYKGEEAVKVFNAHSKSLIGFTKKAAFAGTVAAAEYVADYIRNMIGVQGTRDDRSLPGEPPKRQSGELQNSIRVLRDNREQLAVVYSDSEHWWYLEYGTKKMKPRPFWRRSIAETKVDLHRVVMEGILEYLATEAQPR